VTAAALLLASGVPIEVGRDEARSAARRELARPEYAVDRPPLAQRIGEWVLDFFSDLLDAASRASPGGYGGLLVLLALVVAAIIAIRLRVGPLGRAAAGEDPLFVGVVRSADEHRRAAEEHARASRWDEALRERLRAVIRDLEERAILDERPGRTADEAAREAGAALPEQAAGLCGAATAFDDVWYGGRPATAEVYRRLVDLDEAVRRTRPAARRDTAPAGAFAEPPR
jgi:hypothetical protein